MKTKTKKIETSKKKSKKHQIEDITDILSERQALFAILYTTDKTCFGNATLAYKRAYNLKDSQYNAAGVSAYHLLRNPKMQAFIKKFLQDRFNSASIDNEISKVATQDRDLHAKMRAIEEFNKLKQRITDTPITINMPSPLLNALFHNNRNAKASAAK
ncbi:MAG: terminase small subunit [Patescibacteria group bacterium]